MKFNLPRFEKNWNDNMLAHVAGIENLKSLLENGNAIDAFVDEICESWGHYNSLADVEWLFDRINRYGIIAGWQVDECQSRLDDIDYEYEQRLMEGERLLASLRESEGE